MQKILITGPESSGKSELAAALGAHYGVPWVPEFARQYLEHLPRPYEEADLLCILEGQLRLEAEKAAPGPPLLVCDTGPEVIYIWSRVRFNRVHPKIARATLEHPYDLPLLCYPDLPWAPDPLREAPDEAVRLALFEQYATVLYEMGRPYKIIRGRDAERWQCALRAVADVPLP